MLDDWFFPFFLHSVLHQGYFIIFSPHWSQITLFLDSFAIKKNIKEVIGISSLLLTKKVICIIQARMNSKRLPGKVLVDIEGKPAIWHIYNRLKKIPNISQIIISATNELSDKPLKQFAETEGISYFAGSENDLLDRAYKTGREFDCEVLIKINADCPLIDHKLIEDGIEMFFSSEKTPDLVTNCLEETFPEGMQYAVFNFQTIEKIWSSIEGPFWREYFYRFILENKEKFFIINIKNKKDQSDLRWTLDYPEDLIFVRKVYEKLYNKNPVFGMNEILSLLSNEPQILEINKKHSSKIGLEEFNKLRDSHK